MGEGRDRSGEMIGDMLNPAAVLFSFLVVVGAFVPASYIVIEFLKAVL